MAPHNFKNSNLAHISLMNEFDVRRLGKKVANNSNFRKPYKQDSKKTKSLGDLNKKIKKKKKKKKNITKSIWNVYQAFKAIDVFQRR
jgi:hypothetical protein